MNAFPFVYNAGRAAVFHISILTPSYNQGQYIEETIRSVLLQGYPALEYMITDGVSNDNAIEIIRKYEPWLSYWVSESDSGHAHEINKGSVVHRVKSYSGSTVTTCYYETRVPVSEQLSMAYLPAQL